MAVISGVSYNVLGVPRRAMVRAYRQDTGMLSGWTVSDETTGAYTIPYLVAAVPHTVVCHFVSGSPADPYWAKTVAALRMVDSLTDIKGKTFTNSGITFSTTETPFAGGAGSASFNGSSWASLSGNTDLQFGTGDFSMRFRAKLPTGQADYATVIGHETPTGVAAYVNHLSLPNKILLFIADAAIGGAISVVDNQWHEIDISREGGVARIKVDGVLDAEGALAGNASSSNFRIGRSVNGQPMTGYMTDLLITKGSAREAGSYLSQPFPFLETGSLGTPDENAQVFDNVIPG